MVRPLPIHHLHSQEIFFVLVYVCIRAGNPRVPPRVLASGSKPCGGNYGKTDDRRGYRKIQLAKISDPNKRDAKRETDDRRGIWLSC